MVRGRRADPRLLSAALVTLVVVAGCWRLGEPMPSEALVSWVAYPETVQVGATFSFEFAGPVSPNACGRLDTATLAITDSTIELAARRSTFQAMCARQKVSFYEARPIEIMTPGRYLVRTSTGGDLGTLVATDSGPFSSIKTWGEGTIRHLAGCWLFGPGWIGGQRLFALSGLPEDLEEIPTDRIVYVRGRLRGFASCGSWGSRPRIRVDTAWATGRRVKDLY